MTEKITEIASELEGLEGRFENEDNEKFGDLEKNVEHITVSTKSRYESILGQFSASGDDFQACSDVFRPSRRHFGGPGATLRLYDSTTV